jgi:hypothetical protein
MIKQLDLFCLTKNVESNKKISFDENGENSEKCENSSVLTANSNNEESQAEEYLEILKLRHINLARYVGLFFRIRTIFTINFQFAVQ